MPEKGGRVITPEGPWQPIKWGKESCFGYLLKPARGKRKGLWAVAFVLPADADPRDFKIDYVESDYGPHRRHTDQFVVDYKVIGQEARRLIGIPLSSEGRRIDKSHFSVHASNVSSGNRQGR